ncbi:hypothetical protein PC123_g20469 [Phytophthora cactorum]|nr:hypothetical protein PC120_g20970 [Phytophthora cactorum]KAG4044080.1 hypothetical protein PC123_g20469 [Phytophthora cactorum]
MGTVVLLVFFLDWLTAGDLKCGRPTRVACPCEVCPCVTTM